MATPQELRTISPGELSQRWGLATSTLSEQRKRGTGPAWRVNGSGRIEYLMTDIWAWERRRAAADATDISEVRMMKATDVADLLGVSRSHFDRMVASGEFPGPVRLGAQTRRWLRTQVLNAIAERAAA